MLSDANSEAWPPTSAPDDPTELQKKHAQFQIFKRNVLTDVECVVQGHVFRTHRALLVFYSSYLKKKLIDAEGRPTCSRLHIPKIGVNEFEILLRYMYSENLEADCNNIFEVYTAATVLEMQDVKSKCLQVIDGKNEIRTYFYAYVLSKKLGLQQNWQKALKLITHRFEEAGFTKEFMRLDLNYVVEVLSSQSIGARSEIIVFLAALNWLNQDFGSRGVNAVTVMECVRFSTMTMEEIVACYHPPFLSQVVQIPAVTMILLRATCYIAAKSQGQESWFKKYSNPKRDLAFEDLSVELWHKSPSTTTLEADIPDQDFNKLPKHSHSIKQRNVTPSTYPECSRCPEEFDSQSTRPKYVYPNIDSLQKRCDDSGSEEDDRITEEFRLHRENKTNRMLQNQEFFRDSEEELESDNESYSSDKADIARKLGLSEEDDMFHQVLENKAYQDKKTIPSKVQYQNVTDGPRETQYFIPENTKIIHLIKGPFKSGKEDPKPKHAKETGTENIELINMKVESSPKNSKANQSVEGDESKESENISHPGVQTDDIEVGRRNVLSSSDKVTSNKENIKEGCILIVGGMDPTNLKKETGEAVLIFNDKTNKWIHYSNMPEARHNHCAACIENILYVVGGCNQQETIAKNQYIPKRSCFKLNLNKSKWSTMPHMKCARFDHAMVVFDGKLFVIGGKDETGRFLKSVEMYSPKRNRWKLLHADMCCGRTAMGATVYKECIWVAGGLVQTDNKNQLEAVSYVDCYYPREKKWRFSLYQLPSPRCFSSLIAWNEKLLCLGGMVRTNDGETCPTDEVWILKSEKGTWKRGPSLPAPRVGGRAVIYRNSLYFLGGFNLDNASDIRNVSVLKPGVASWISEPPLSCHLFGFSVASSDVA